jgi:hypothetical protein
VSVIPDYPDSAAHVATAAQIAATGVPLLAKPAQLISVIGESVPAAGSVILTPVTVTQTGYSGMFWVEYPSAATEPFLTAEFIWTDSASGTVVATENRVLLGSESVVWQTVATGICKADTLTLILWNADPAQAATVTVLLNQDSVTRSRDSWYWRNRVNSTLTVPGYTVAGLPPDESVIGMLNGATVAATDLVNWVIGPADGGLVTVSFQFGTVAASNVRVGLAALPASAYGPGPLSYDVTPAASGYVVTYQPPRCPVQVGISNTATSGTLTVDMLAVRDTS